MKILNVLNILNEEAKDERILIYCVGATISYSIHSTTECTYSNMLLKSLFYDN